MNQPTKDSCGFWIYKELPEGSVLLSVEMFNSGLLRLDMPFVVFSELYKEYQCFRVKQNTVAWIMPFIVLNRVYAVPGSSQILTPNEQLIQDLELEF
ncbi:MAG: hypothetical protein ACOYO1_19360 [Bacteroidales bacterium]